MIALNWLSVRGPSAFLTNVVLKGRKVIRSEMLISLLIIRLVRDVDLLTLTPLSIFICSIASSKATRQRRTIKCPFAVSSSKFVYIGSGFHANLVLANCRNLYYLCHLLSFFFPFFFLHTPKNHIWLLISFLVDF